MRAGRSLTVLCAVVLAACTPGASPGPSLTPVPSTPMPPTPTPAPSPSQATGFTIDVFPPEEPAGSRVAILDSKYCFLVILDDAAPTAGPATITATATRAKVVQIVPSELQPGVVGEVCVVADDSTVETTGSVTITATRGGVTASVDRSLPIFPMADERAADARPYFELWVAWLAAAHPELGITADTAWEPVFVSMFLVVSHYSYWSEDWEMTVAWHVMIPPDDWTEVHLRHRGTETAPGAAFRIDSVSGKTGPRAVEPPEVVVR